MLFGAVKELGDVLFQMDPCDSYLLLMPIGLYHEASAAGDGGVVLRDLVALHQVRVWVVLAVELGVLLAMVHPSASPVLMTSSTACLLMTGRTPGIPMHTGQTKVLDGASW